MCWAIKIALRGRSGILENASIRAVGPPVDDAIAMKFLGATVLAGKGAAGRLAASSVARRSGSAPGRMFLATRIFCKSSVRIRLSSESTNLSGLAMKSRAPRSSALNTFSFWLYEETMMTGIGLTLIRMRKNVNPSIRGISRSSVIASGRSSVTNRNASSPSPALPTTSTSGSEDSISDRLRRLKAESSTTRTRSLEIAVTTILD